MTYLFSTMKELQEDAWEVVWMVVWIAQLIHQSVQEQVVALSVHLIGHLDGQDLGKDFHPYWISCSIHTKGCHPNLLWATEGFTFYGSWLEVIRG